MPVTTRIEVEKRVRAVQDWLIQDKATVDIVNYCVSKWGVCERQAKRYIKTASERWVEEEEGTLKMKRARRVQSLKRLINNMDPAYVVTPAGVNAIGRIYDRIIMLEGTKLTPQMVEALAAVDKGKQADPLEPSTSSLKIEVLPPYGTETQTITTTGTGHSM